MRQVHVPSEEHNPPRKLPAETQDVEQVDQHCTAASWGAGAGAADVMVAKVRAALRKVVKCIFGLDWCEYLGDGR